MLMLLKKPDSTTSRPHASPVQVSIMSFETMPSWARSANTSQVSFPRIDIDESTRATG